MILTKEVNIYIKGISIKRYKELGYDINTKEKNIINVKDLSKNSNVKIDVKCDICGTEKNLKVQDYFLSYKNNKYSCSKCSKIEYKKTMIEKYGVENSFQLENVKKLSKDTKKLKYKDINFNNRNKSKQTCIEKYGVENPQQNNDIKNKTNNTNIKKYGFAVASKNISIKEKMLNTNLTKWNSKCTLHSELLKYKIKDIFISKYGVDNPMKNINIMKKSQISSLKRKQYNNTNLLYQGTYELDFLIKYYNKIDIENGISIKIIFNKKDKMYHSDFYIPSLNLIIEIKSSYWYNKYLELNKLKEKTCKELGYNFLFIKNKNYEELEKLKEELKKLQDEPL